MPSSTTAERSSARLSSRAVEDLLRERVPPVAVPLHYRLGLVLVAGTMVLLPLVYVALVGLALLGVGLYAVHGLAIFDHSASLGKVLIYVGPLAVGGLLIAFMVKPFFAPSPSARESRSLSAEEEPVLFAFVRSVCACVGAPFPSELRVSGDVNASASFRRGLWSFLSSDLVLTVGLPLAAGTSVRQLAGVLAHEFGHFAQAAGMRLVYVIRMVNAWFARVVYERDAWDEHLARASSEADLRIGVFLHLARLFIWLTRGVLWLLMHLGHAVSCFMLRQMEFDADRYEVAIAGSETFEATMLRLHELNLGTGFAHRALAAAHSDGRLADDLPGLILAHTSSLPPEAQAHAREAIASGKTGLFDTHPADVERVASARAERRAGLLEGRPEAALPARALFANFDELCRAVTADTYGDALGAEGSTVTLVPVAELLERSGQERARREALQRFWQEHFSVLRPLGPSSEQIAASGRTALEEARAALLAGAAEYGAAFARFDEQDTAWIAGESAAARRSAGLDAGDEAMAGPPEPTEAMRSFEAAARRRLQAALGLLEDEGAAHLIEDQAALRARATAVLPVAIAIGQLLPELTTLRKEMAQVVALLTDLPEESSDRLRASVIEEHLASLRRRVTEVHTRLGEVPYPFDHASGGMSVASFAVEPLPPPDDHSGFLQASRALLESLYQTYARAMGELALVAEAVEAACGLPPLAPPATPEQAHKP